MKKLLLLLLLLAGTLSSYAQSSISVISTNPNNTYVAGETLTITYIITNNGTETAYDVRAVYALPAYLQPVPGIKKFWWTGDNGTSGFDNIGLDETTPVLAANQSKTYTINIKIPRDYAGPVSNLTVTYKKGADINTVVTDNKTTYVPGTQSVYTVIVSNNGGDTAPNVAVSVPVPAGITGFSWTGNGTYGTNTAVANTIASLAPGQSASYTVTVNVPAGFTGPLTLTASNTLTNFADPNLTCTTCSDTDTAATPGSYDVVIKMTDSKEVYTAGTNNIYTVTVTNDGPDTAAGIVVSNPVPAGITAFSWVGSNGTSGSGAINQVIATLAAGQTVTYMVTVGVPAGHTANIENTATATSAGNDSNTANNTVTDIDYATGSADLVVTKTLNQGTTYTAGLNAIYTITVRNDGPTAAQNVSVTDAIPAGLTAASAAWTGSNGSSGTGNLTNVIPTLAVGETVTYRLTVPVPANFSTTTNIVNQVVVTSPTPDPNPACAGCTHTATPNPLANLITYKTNGQTTYIGNTEVVYTIVVTNPGPSDARNVVVHDTKPYNIDVMSWEGNNTGGSGTLHNIVPVLAAGQSLRYTVTMFVKENHPVAVGPLVNTVSVTSSTPDPVVQCLGCTDTDTASATFVTIDKTAYSTEELVLDVLIDTDCINVYDIIANAGDIYGNYGISYFNRNNSNPDNFPIQDGIIIRNGNAKFSEGRYSEAGPPDPISSAASGATATDADLEAFNPNPARTLRDVSYLQFRFVPLSNEMSFDYLFAANEYGTWQCGYYDTFAFILTDETAGTPAKNIALVPIPNSNTPVSVGTIRNGAYNTGCGSVNSAFFGRYNVTDVANSTINHRGQTVLLKAAATVVPGHVYKIKLAVGDAGDTQFDSAVFLAGGSFNIGQPKLPGDKSFGNAEVTGNPLCNGETYVLGAASGDISSFIIRWEKDGVLLTDANGVPISTPTINVTTPGIYTLKTAFPSSPNCFLTDDIKIEYRPDAESGMPNDLTLCGDPTQPMAFNLFENNAVINAGAPNPSLFEIEYYRSEAEFLTGFPPFYTMPYMGHNNETVVAILRGTDNLCYTVLPFTLHIYDCEIDMEPYTAHLCDPAPYDNVETFDLTAYTDEMTVEEPVPAGYVYTFYNNATDAQAKTNAITTPSAYAGANNEVVWVRADNSSVNQVTIYGIDQLTLLVTPVPAIADTPDVSACTSYTLPPLPANTNYYTETAAGGNLLAAGTALTTSQTVYTYVAEGTPPYTCSNEDSFDLTIYTPPIVEELNDVAACDFYELQPLLTGNYYTGAGGTGTMLPASTLITVTQTIYVYALTGDAQAVCEDESDFIVTINNAPVVVQPDPLEACDDNTDGFTIFDLTQRNAQILNGQTGLTITWHRTDSDAQLGILPIATPASHSDDSGTVYASVVQSGTTTGCRSVVPLQLIVNPRPANPLVGNLSLCDDNNSPDGLEVFDLTLNDAAARGNDATLVVQYYRSLLEAQGNTNPITTPAAFPNTTPNQQTIWVGVTTASGCRSIGSFSLIVNPLPVLSTDPADYIAYECEEVTNMADFNLNEIASTITEGSSSYVVYFYKTDGQARAGGPDFEPSTYQAGNSFIYARVINPSTNCIRIAEVELRVIPAPIATQPAPLSVCDENTDTFGTFNLLPTMQAIEASLTNVVVTAYETQSDADLGVIPIPNPGSYPTINPNTQTLYLRVQSTLTECYDTVTLVLIVNPRPAAVSPAAAYALCDDGVSDNDGQAVFNLNTQSAEILNGLDPAQYSIAYYTDATATALIGTPGNFVSGTATVYARVTNNATGCFYIVPVRLVVNGLPVLITNQYSYSLCDTSGDPDREEFDLTSVIGQFITDGNRNGVSVQFYTSLAAAQAGGTGPELITGETAYTNVPPQVQSLYVRFEVMATGCYRLGYLDIRVEPQPVIEEPSAEELTVCDTNGTGIGTFDLEALKAGMANGGANLDITFHLTYEDAVSGANPIPNTTNYKNGNPYTEILYVRVVNTVSGCYNTRPYAITLHVNPAPQAPDLADITLCDDIDNNGQDGAAKTDITLYEDDIDAAVDPVDVDITYYTSEADANTPVRAIANPATYTAHDNQVIWVRVEDAAGCYSVTSFTIHFNKPHALVNPTPFALCNELLPNDGITSFDLTQKDDEILGAAGVGRGYTVEYFTTNPKGNTGAVAIPDPKAFTNTTNPQVIYVRVTTKAGCVSYTSLSIKVLPLPEPNFNPAPLVLCDDDQATAGSEPFDLTDAGDDILANGDYELSYYETEEDANNKVNPIPDPTSYTSTGGVVYVRVEANTNNPAEPGCYQVVALTLRVDPLPPVADLDDLAHCEQGTDGQDTFNLLEAINTALGGNTAGEYEVEVYEDPALTTPAIPITAYEVTGGTATVYVVVESTATGCRIVKELQLYVEEAATANPVADPSPVCDTEGGNDGVVTWDLTQFDSDALGTQAPGVYQVTYHTTEQDAIDGINAIATPQAYENTPQEQVLWVRVTNTATITKCSDVTSFTLRVEIRPEPVITGEGGSNTICIDFGATEGELVLNSGVVPAGHTYQWFKGGVLLSDSDQSGEYTARTEGVYTVIVTGPAPLNCVSDTSAAFTVVKSGQASQVGKGYYVTNYFSDNQTITVNVEGNGEYTYQLDNGPRQPDPVFTNVSPGYHKVTVYDEKTDFPCQELTIDGVSIVDYPNFFTPNGDGFHDTWNIIGLSGTGSVIYIFDRYGKLIKQISPDLNSDGWDGTMNGVPVPATDYWFSVTYPEFDGTTTVTKEFKSHFSLKR